MAHIVKCDGKKFFVPAGYLRTLLSDLSSYMESGEIDYKALKSEIKKQELKDLLPREDMGFIDFDQMEQRKSEKLVVVGDYYHFLGRLAKFV